MMPRRAGLLRSLLLLVQVTACVWALAGAQQQQQQSVVTLESSKIGHKNSSSVQKSHSHQALAAVTANASNNKQTNQVQPAVERANSSAAQQPLSNVSNNRHSPASNCSRPCTNAEFASILNKISLNVDILRDYQRNEAAPTTTKGAADQTIRPECLKQLVKMIKNLASGELEMKTLLEFASSTSTINNLRSDLSYLRSSMSQDATKPMTTTTTTTTTSSGQQISEEVSPHVKDCHAQDGALKTSSDQATTSGNNVDTRSQRAPEYLLGDELPGSVGELEAKMNFLPKLVANVDHWLDSIERFTVTREWAALTRVFNSLESILGMFAPAAGATASHQSPSKSIGAAMAVAQNNNSARATNASASANSTAAALSAVANQSSSEQLLIAQLERDLPRQTQIVTSSLNQLFPWHVWPWNNIDLYSTIDTFLNHGIFAFSKTTAGPERRIDFLPQMLEALFKSLRYDSFPKKCNDWSRIICDLELFYDRLALAPLDSSDAQQLQQRQAQVRELTGNNKNKLTQELVCIMFSSLSMQQFGGIDAASINNTSYDSSDEQQQQQQQPFHNTQTPSNQLKWDRQIRKGLRLYKLSREALSDDQWRALQKQLNALWSQIKISDRVIMVGRIIQLLTNCHMPREILESALWKDIYKYKNALNQISDIVIEELNRSAESGQFTIERLSLGSKHLEDILVRFVKLLPRLIESLSRTLTDQLPELVGKFFDEKIAFFKGPCKGHSFGQLVPSLALYHDELSQLEKLICQQLSTKPSITMMQINNLTNEILAMAFNFTNFGGTSPFQSLPRLWSGNFDQTTPPTPATSVAPSGTVVVGAETTATTANASKVGAQTTNPANIQTQQPNSPNATKSIIDELAENPRLAPIVAILQSSALDPPEVHAELPELDWVEAGTSVALFYESIQKLMSYEGLFVIFPEVANFQEEIGTRLEASKQMFTRFGKRDAISLTAYSLDTVIPVALRTFQPLDSFHSECLSTFRDIFGETDSFSSQSLTVQPVISRESRQWQCAVSTTNFVSYALNNLIRTFNHMLRNILAQMSRQRDMFKFNKQQQQQVVSGSSTGNAKVSGVVASSGNVTTNTLGSNTSTCVLFDGSVTTLMDNLPHLVDLALETLLVASTNFNQRTSLKETLCAFENTLDPLGEQQLIQRQLKLREAVCHLLHESSLATCSDALKVDMWTSTMKELNVTWFEMSAISVEPSFRGILTGVHEFMDLFGKVKPSSMSDGLLARVLNFKSYWTSLVNKAMSSFEKYKERRFQVALQILMPIIYENLPAFQLQNERSKPEAENEVKHGLKTSILAARSLLVYLGKSDSSISSGGGSGDSNSNSSATQTNSTREAPAAAAAAATGGARVQLAPSSDPAANQDQIDAQLRSLLDWSDRYSIVITETLLRTAASNISKLESLIIVSAAVGNNSSTSSTSSATSGWSATWLSFCSQPIETYLEFDIPSDSAANKATLPSQVRLADMSRAREFICNMNWAGLEERLFLQSARNETASLAGKNNSSTQIAASIETTLDHYSTRQLVRVALTKWGQVLDLAVSLMGNTGGAQKTSRLPKFLSLKHWQQLQERLPSIAPSENDPNNFTWVWRALERLINVADDQRQQQQQQQRAVAASESNQTTSAHAQASVSIARTSEALIRICEQLNCALDTIKGGMTWDNMVNIYQDRQDVLAAHSTLNNGIALVSAGANTFLAHKKFQKFLNNFVKPHMGLAAFCEVRDKARLESIFSLDTKPSGSATAASFNDDDAARDRDELVNALESFQEFICDTNIESLVANVNPISVCYQGQQQVTTNASSGTLLTNSTTTTTLASTSTAPPTGQDQEFPLADAIEHFFKLASLAILDAKLVDTSDAKPPIFNKSQWDQLRAWWLNQTEVHQGNSGLALTLVRVFQTLDSINSEHVVWRAIFRSVHELSEVSAYLLRAAEMERQANMEMRERGQPTKFALIREAAEQVDGALKAPSALSASAGAASGTSGLKFGHKQQQLASTMANVMFPEVSNFISLRTFKQLRYIKSISEYFASAPGAQELICRNLTRAQARQAVKSGSNNSNSSNSGGDVDDVDLDQPTPLNSSKFELLDYKLNTSKRLYSLLCHYHSSQWLTAMNIVLSSKTSSLTKKVNYMTKYLSIFTRNFEHNENLQSFIHGQQLENIEAVANKTVSYMIALSQPFRTLTLSKISNISWYSIPSLLDSIDKHLCASKYEQQQQQQQQQQSSVGNTNKQNNSTHSSSGTDSSSAAAVVTGGYQLAVYEPKKPDIEVIICKLPSWNITQVYNYFSENIDLQNMISLATQDNNTAKLLGIELGSAAGGRSSASSANKQPVCITPFKFSSKWIKIIQELIDEAMSKSSKDRIKKCLSLNKKGQSAYVQTMRYVRILNSLLATLDDMTRNNSWPMVKKTWSSISYAILNQSGSAPIDAQSQALQTPSSSPPSQTTLAGALAQRSPTANLTRLAQQVSPAAVHN